MTTTTRPIYQVSEFTQPNETITTIIDATVMKVPYIKWPEIEIDRWAHNANAREAWVQQDKEGMVALFSWAEYQKPIEGEE
jgi:hypothetical protein